MKLILTTTAIALAASTAFADQATRTLDTPTNAVLTQSETPVALSSRNTSERERKVRDGTYVSINNDSR